MESGTLVRERAAEDSKRFALILAPAVVYGPGNTANLFSMVDALARGRFFLVGRNDIKSLISLKNLCAAVVYLLPRMQPGVEVYNLVDERSYSVRELASMMARHGYEMEWTIVAVAAKGIASFGDAFTSL
jgi:GlcNAc-P-P-Und epimerase